MLAALVIFGAVACTENQEENVPQAELKPVLSFVANIANDETRVNTVEENGVWKTVWSANETLIVYGPGAEEYEFTLTDAENGVFTCCENGVLDLIGEPVQIDNGYVNSKADKQGAWIWTEIDRFNPTDDITLEVQSSFFRFTAAQDVVFTATEDIFVVDGVNSKTVTISAGEEEQWVAFLPYSNCTFSYSIDGVKCKEITKDFVAKKIYNLGFLGAPSEWEISDGTRFYTTETPDLFVAKNVKLTANNFCVHKVGDTAWGAGAKYGLVTAATKSVDTAIGLYSANWAGDVTISNATTTAHDIYFDRANSRLYVMTVGKHPSTVANPTHGDFYNIAGSMNNWGTYTEAQKFVYSGDNVWHLVIDFKANDEFKVQKNNGWGTCYGHKNIQSGVGKDLSNGSDNAKMKAAGTYEIWVIPSHTDAPLYIIKR